MVKQNKKLIKTLSVKRTKAILAVQTHTSFYGNVSNTKLKTMPKQKIKKYCVRAPQKPFAKDLYCIVFRG